MKTKRQSFAFVNLWPVLSTLIVALLLPVQSAQAVLITRDVNVTLSALNLESFSLDLDQNGSTDFTLSTQFAPDPSFPVGFAVVSFPPASLDNAVVIDLQTGDGFPPASRLLTGDIVSAGSLFSNSSDQANLFSLIGDPSGNFGGANGVLGLRFDDGVGGILFGFASILVNDLGSPSPFDLTIRTVGFNDAVAASVVIPSVVPEPATLSLLAFAGLGLLTVSGWTRRRRAARARGEAFPG